MKKLQHLYFSSSTYYIYTLVQKYILKNPIYLFFTDFSFVSALWHKSFFYKFLYDKLERYAKKFLKKRTISASLCVYFLLLILILPENLLNLWQSILIVLLILLLNIRSPRSTQYCCDLMIYLSFCSIFLLGLYLLLPLTSFFVIISLVVALSIYFLVSGLITNKSDFFAIFKALLILLLLLCSTNITSIIWGYGFINTPSVVCDIIILTLPLSLLYLFNTGENVRQYLFVAFLLFITSFTIILAKNLSSLIGYCVSLVIFTAFTKPRYLFIIFLVFPGVILFSLNEFFSLWIPNKAAFFNIEGILYTTLNFWSTGISFGTSEFLHIYNSTIYHQNVFEHSKTFLQVGYAILIVVLWYTLKIIRSAIFNIFTVKADTRQVFLAVLCSLVGFSASALIASSSFTLEGSICYWLILGILSAQTKLATKNNEL